MVELLTLLTLWSGVCSIGTPLFRSSAETLVVHAVATGEVVPLEIPEDLRVDSAIPDSVNTAPAFRFEVLRAAGPGAPQSGDVIEIVPWEYDPSCAREVWSSESWVSGDSEVVFLLGPSRQESAERFDVLGWHRPYPDAEFLRFRHRTDVPSDRTDWLSPSDYFDLVVQLPPGSSSFPEAELLEQIESIFADGPERWSLEFPGSEILHRFRRARAPDSR